MKPTFAAVILNYNDSAQIGVAISCVLEQTVPFDEILIVDDVSTDNSVEIIREMIRDVPQARLHCNKKNMGVVANCDNGILLIKSDYVHLISANDTYFPCIVEYGHKMVERYPGVAMISANVAVWDAVKNCAGPDMVMRLPQVASFISPEEYTARNRVAPVSMNGGGNTIRRDVYLALGGQDVALKWYADWFLYYLIGFTHGFAYVPVNYSVYRIEGKKSFSSGLDDPYEQKMLTLRMVDLLRERYPAQAQLFRETAIVPKYSLNVLMALTAAPYRWFITPLLVWRCIGHQCAFWLKKFLPRQFLMAVRAVCRL